MLPEDRGSSQRLDSRRHSPSGGLGDDRLDQLPDPLAVLLRRKIPPAGQGHEVHDFGLRELSSAEFLAAQARRPFPCAIEPSPLDRLADEQSGDAMNPRPILKSGDQVLLAAAGIGASLTRGRN